MGIPSYFSYIIKNHANIVRALADTGRIQHLFMDCNSIIYDLFHALKDVVVLDEDALIQQVIEKIVEYVQYIRPTKTLYIAFDGVAPLAKMDQQRTRRHKALWTSSDATTAWSTCNITPGTPFMLKLSERVSAAFGSGCNNNNTTTRKIPTPHQIQCETVIVSAADECGEGEHKLFQYIRKQQSAVHDNAAVYGLDSDLIMLSLFHCAHFKKLYVFRETPEFIKSQIACQNDDPCHFLDMAHLSSAILQEMRTKEAHAIYDYVFMCFFLGNDFLPHFPALNLRTHGLPVLLDTYRKVISSRSMKNMKSTTQSIVSIDGDGVPKVQWKQVHRFVQALAKLEPELWKQEYETRAKWGNNRKWSMANEKDRDMILQNVPVIYRAEELYIAPETRGWEGRYYRALLPNAASTQDVCRNYYEGLAWVFQYYTQDCKHWRWRYEYDYPPLLRDLAAAETPLPEVVYESHPPVTAAVQLAYVIPQALHDTLLDPGMVEELKAAKYADIFARPTNAFQWAFCRYFWESHVHLSPISTSVLNEWTRRASTQR